MSKRFGTLFAAALFAALSVGVLGGPAGGGTEPPFQTPETEEQPRPGDGLEADRGFDDPEEEEPGADPARAAASGCPSAEGLKEHGGLVWISPEPFALKKQVTDHARIVTQVMGRILCRRTVEQAAADTDRTAPLTLNAPELAELRDKLFAFRWDGPDFADTRWMPQGVSGTFDAFPSGLLGSKTLVAVSWYHKDKQGSRVSFVDISRILADRFARYRHVLLVEPFIDPVTKRMNFKPVAVHAGGIAWLGNTLYVADSIAGGFRVFDLGHLFAVNALDPGRVGYVPETGRYSAFGYKYILPQTGAYTLAPGSCYLRFSYVSVLRSLSGAAPCLVSGEWSPGFTGKTVVWPTGGALPDQLRTNAQGVVKPVSAWFNQEKEVQGAVFVGGSLWLSASPGGNGYLRRVTVGSGVSSWKWVFGPEDLMYSPFSEVLVGASEFAGRRYVWGVRLWNYR